MNHGEQKIIFRQFYRRHLSCMSNGKSFVPGQSNTTKHRSNLQLMRQGLAFDIKYLTLKSASKCFSQVFIVSPRQLGGAIQVKKKQLSDLNSSILCLSHRQMSPTLLSS